MSHKNDDSYHLTTICLASLDDFTLNRIKKTIQKYVYDVRRKSDEASEVRPSIDFVAL